MMEVVTNLLPNVSANSVLILTMLVLIIVYFLRDRGSYWNKKGVSTFDAQKMLKSSLKLLIGRMHVTELYHEMYRELGDHSFGGSFQGIHPMIYIKDPKVAKAILVKGFTNFHDHGPPPVDNEEPLAQNIFFMTGARWRQRRQKLSPGFSSVKLKIMHQTLENCVKELNTYLEKHVSRIGGAEIELKELVSNYTLDVIGALVLGIKCNATHDPDCEFKKLMVELVQGGFKTYLFYFLEVFHPKLPRWLGLSLLKRESLEYLQQIIRETMQLKENERAVDRKDFLQMVMNHRDNESEERTKEDHLLQENGWAEKEEIFPDEENQGPIFSESFILGTVITFLTAGFEPITVTLSFCLHELAFHPEIQEKIFDEIRAVKAESRNGTISYEDLRKLKYTDQVINETLRKHPPAGIIIRVCTEPFLIPDTSVVVDKGTRIYVDMASIQNDQKYFPEPEKFNPDRFSEKNTDKIISGTFQPFGDGPRFCIGMRLALLNVKTMLIGLISNYHLRLCERTPEIGLDKKQLLLTPAGDIWVRMERRK